MRWVEKGFNENLTASLGISWGCKAEPPLETWGASEAVADWSLFTACDSNLFHEGFIIRPVETMQRWRVIPEQIVQMRIEKESKQRGIWIKCKSKEKKKNIKREKKKDIKREKKKHIENQIMMQRVENSFWCCVAFHCIVVFAFGFHWPVVYYF
jgi:predicted RNA-binding protein YlxR (DUF448 family)